MAHPMVPLDEGTPSKQVQEVRETFTHLLKEIVEGNSLVSDTTADAGNGIISFVCNDVEMRVKLIGVRRCDDAR